MVSVRWPEFVARISINDLQEKSLGAAEVRSLIALGKLHKDVGRDRWSSAGHHRSKRFGFSARCWACRRHRRYASPARRRRVSASFQDIPGHTATEFHVIRGLLADECRIAWRIATALRIGRGRRTDHAAARRYQLRHGFAAPISSSRRRRRGTADAAFLAQSPATTTTPWRVRKEKPRPRRLRLG